MIKPRSTMKKVLFLFALILLNYTSFSQETFDPKVSGKSSNDTYINKIVITENHTVVYMKYVSKSLREQLDEYLKNNPRLRQQLDQLDSYTRRIYMERLAMQMRQGGNTISFQPSSYLKSKDGKRYKFIKASSIPVSPDNIIVEPDKRYYFRVYFERLDPGIEEVDLIEGENGRDGSSMTYWNFYGVVINNPGNEEPVSATREEPEEIEAPIEISKPKTETAVRIVLSGKVLDAETEEPISAKIVCIAKDSNAKYDSIITSRSGSYEFEVSPDDYLYKVSAPGYRESEESYDLSSLKSSKSFTRNFYLERLTLEEEEPEIQEEIVEVIKPKESTSPVEVKKNTFRLDKVYFNLGEASLLPESFEQLNGLISMMNADPNMRIQVIGHTDNQGDSKLNKKLSLRRAFNVREYLIDKGIDGKRIKFKGVGGDFPIAPNDSEENRQKNRRVEFVIIDKS